MFRKIIGKLRSRYGTIFIAYLAEMIAPILCSRWYLTTPQVQAKKNLREIVKADKTWDENSASSDFEVGPFCYDANAKLLLDQIGAY